jgi:riboflavin kinase/FMN adenylyltransferase
VKILHGLDAPFPPLPELVLGIGIFDGVHRGHQTLLERVVRQARTRRGTAGALTFHPHPLTILAPPRAPRLLISLEHRLRLLGRLGLDISVVVPFTAAVASVEAETFVEEVLIGRLGARQIVTGDGFRFGRGGCGDVRLLRTVAARRRIVVESVPPVAEGGQPISSTVIREAIERGDLTSAARLLGRPASVLGRVTMGSGRGRRLGFPTANLLVDEEVAPPRGVYAVVAALDDGVSYRGVANVGVRPTFAEPRRQPLVEVHLFGYSGTLYGEMLEVSFVAKLRDEQAFVSPDALAAQIARDVAQAHRLLADPSTLLSY